MKKLIFKSIVYSFVLVFAVSCSKDDDSNKGTKEISKTEVKSVLETGDITGIADVMVTNAFKNKGNSGKSSKTTEECYVGTYGENSYKLVFSDCDAGEGKKINGTINVTFTPGSLSYTATYVDFTVGDISISGTRTFTIGIDLSNLSNFTTMVSSDMTVIKGNGDTVIITGTQNFTFSVGENQEDVDFSLSGDWNVKINSDTYKINISESLIGSASCTYFTKGVMEITKNDYKVSVDFGDGACDAIATLTKPDGSSEEITLDD
ncbi:MAG: hypothetical protein V3U92_12870 [Cellulophaga sp.]